MRKNGFSKKMLCLGLAGCITLSGCTWGQKAVSETREKFDAYMDELFKSEVTGNTLNLHYMLAYPEDYGITDYEVSLGDYSLEQMEQGYESMEELKEELSKFDVSKLTEEQKLTYDVVMDYLDTELQAKDLVLYTEVLSPTTGYQSQLPVILAEYTFRTEQDIEDYLTLLAQMDDMFADIIEFEKQKSEEGLFMPDYAADAVIEQCSEFIADPENNYMIEVFNDKIDNFPDLSEEEKNAYKEENKTIITTEVVSGFEHLIDGLSSLKGTGTNELGLCYYEEGTEYYEYLVRSVTGSDSSIEELQERTEELIEDNITEMAKIMIRNPEIEDMIMDYSFPITEPEAIMEDLQAKVSEDFPELPEVNYTIKYVHPSMQENMSPAFYLTTPIDDYENNVIYINEKYTGEDAMMDLYTTLAHEGYPGHLYQNVYANSNQMPLVRNLFSYQGYSEGWATYVEEYAYSISGLDEKLAEVLALNNATTLGLYAYIDMGIHYDGWERSDVMNYLSVYGLGDEEIADEIFETMVEEPANYLSYFVGYMEIMELREQAEEVLDDDFELKSFHEFLLDMGPASFYVIEDHMEEWLENKGAE